MNRRSAVFGLGAASLALTIPSARCLADAMDAAETVSFPSLDGRTTLVGYLFRPLHSTPGPRSAVVLLHGRSGPYSSLARGQFNVATLSKRHVKWARFWTERGCFALVVDSFGPRGVGAGFAAGTHANRPADINEVTVRPLDAYGALRYLANRTAEIDRNRIGLQGWSNGGSATLATMATSTLSRIGLPASAGFRAAVAFYPGCGLDGRFRDGYSNYAPVLLLIGTLDEEVSPRQCEILVDRSRRSGSDIAIAAYPDATHDFDDPGRKRQSVSANVAANTDAMAQTAAFMGRYLLF